jgi:hypothetical protein
MTVSKSREKKKEQERRERHELEGMFPPSKEGGSA